MRKMPFIKNMTFLYWWTNLSAAGRRAVYRSRGGIILLEKTCLWECAVNLIYKDTIRFAFEMKKHTLHIRSAVFSFLTLKRLLLFRQLSYTFMCSSFTICYQLQVNISSRSKSLRIVCSIHNDVLAVKNLKPHNSVLPVVKRLKLFM